MKENLNKKRDWRGEFMYWEGERKNKIYGGIWNIFIKCKATAGDNGVNQRIQENRAYKKGILLN